MWIRWLGWASMGLGTLGAVGFGSGWLASLLDDSPPELTVSPLSGPVAGTVLIDVQASDPQGVRLRVGVGPGPLREVEPGPVALDTTALPDGEHTVRWVATDRSWRKNERHEAQRIEVDNTAPSVGLVYTGAAQGQTTAFFVATDEPAEVEVHLGGREHPIFPVGPERWRGLIGFDAQQPTGRATLEIRATDRAGNQTTRALGLDIAETAFVHGGFIQLNPVQTAARLDRSAIDTMRAEREAAFDYVIEAQRWGGPLQLPVQGRKTSPFGKYRTYSDGHRTHHTGVDLANRTGTPVVSAAAGEVRFAGWQTIYGNVVIVHHGQGIATSYNHLDAVEVEVGQQVEAGERVGRLGSTGQSTGPHLHWGLTVHGVKVDAEQWLDTDFSLQPELEQALQRALHEEAQASAPHHP